MSQSLVALIVLALCLGCAAWLVFIWATKKGEFEDVEEPKYRMLHDEDPEESEVSEVHEELEEPEKNS